MMKNSITAILIFIFSIIQCSTLWASCSMYNRLSLTDHSTFARLVNGGLGGQGTGNSQYGMVRAAYPVAGKQYFEFTVAGVTTSSTIMVGLQDGQASLNNAVGYSGTSVSFGFRPDQGVIWRSGFSPATASVPQTLTNGVYGIAYDATNGRFWIRNSVGWFLNGDPANGCSPAASCNSPTPPPLYPAASFYNSIGTVTFNFGATAFSYPVPYGYSGEMCAPDGTLPTEAVVVLGQSNAGNETFGTAYTPRHTISVLNLSSGKLQAGSDPLPNVSTLSIPGLGTGISSFQLPLIDLLLDSGRWENLILAPIAYGGSISSDWIPGGYLNSRITAVASQLANLGVTVRYILWQQGEGDPNTPKETYIDNVKSVRQTFVNSGVNAPFFVPLETICYGAPVQSIRSAQSALIDGVKFFAGPDFDTLTGPTNRNDVGLHPELGNDGCHFSQSSAWDAVAPMWNSALQGH